MTCREIDPLIEAFAAGYLSPRVTIRLPNSDYDFGTFRANSNGSGQLESLGDQKFPWRCVNFLQNAWAFFDDEGNKLVQIRPEFSGNKPTASVEIGVKAAGRQEHLFHRKVYRPWGSYDSIGVGERFQVKRIVVKPGAALSLQQHQHRAEHWIVVSGVAEVTCDERVFDLHENQSTYIPLGSVHRLRNRGSVPVELIEVQSGSYLGEDDIVRLEDVYGRS